jgi:mannosyltransferase OCH1-like enzyme
MNQNVSNLLIITIVVLFLICSYTHVNTETFNDSENKIERKQKIPKIIFSYWHTLIMPDFVRACISSWRKTNKDYDIRIYNEKRFLIEMKSDIKNNRINKKYIPKNLSSIVLDFDAQHHEQQYKADYVRLYLIKKYGGF